MEHHELITKAKEHVARIQPRDSDALSAADFPRVRVRETAMVCFESDERKDRVFVFLDRATGDFITIMYSGGGPLQIHSRS
jgi:hypothetical protein